MDMLKRVLKVLGAAFGSLALLYLFFAWSLPLKNFGLSVEAQLIAQRIITPLVFVALGVLAVSCEYFRRVRLQTGTKSESMGTDPAKPLQNRPFAGTAPTYTSST